MKKKIGIIDYGMGNLWSIKNAFDYLGYENHFFSDHKKLDDFNGQNRHLEDDASIVIFQIK